MSRRFLDVRLGKLIVSTASRQRIKRDSPPRLCLLPVDVPGSLLVLHLALQRRLLTCSSSFPGFLSPLAIIA